MSIDVHQGNLLLCIDHQPLSIGPSFIEYGDGVSSNLTDNNVELAISLSDQDGCFLLGPGLTDLLLGVGCEFLLFFVDLGPGDVLFQLVELSLVISLEICELLLLLVADGQLPVLLFLIVVL